MGNFGEHLEQLRVVMNLLFLAIPLIYSLIWTNDLISLDLNLPKIKKLVLTSEGHYENHGIIVTCLAKTGKKCPQCYP